MTTIPISNSLYAEILTRLQNIEDTLSNLPTPFSGSYTDLSDKPSSFPPSSHSHSDLETRITALETWRGLMKLARMEVFTATTDASGNFSVNTSASFTSPKVLATVVAMAGAEGYHVHGVSVSGTTVTGMVFKNKKQGVLLGGTIDPDEPASGVNVHVLVAQST